MENAIERPLAPPPASVRNEASSSAALERPVSVGDWFVTILLMSVPLIGLIMLFVWAFGGGSAPSKSNWAKAMLIWMLVGMGLGVVFVLLLAALGAAASAGTQAGAGL